MEKAIEELRKKCVKGGEEGGRTTANGLLGIKVADDGSRGAIVEINIETTSPPRTKSSLPLWLR